MSSFGFRFQAIDLRWGVPSEAALDHRTMSICLDEVERCRRLSPRPNFLVLLGDRYGWRPLPSHIPASEFERLLSLVTDRNAAGLLGSWYSRNDNAVPPAYCLNPRNTGGLPGSDDREWPETESKLREALLAGIAGLQLPPEERVKYEASATEQEIRHGALQLPDAHEHVFCYFREITDLPASERSDTDVAHSSKVAEFVDLHKGRRDRAAERLIEKLKTTLDARLPGHTRRYQATWSAAANGVPDAGARIEAILDRLETGGEHVPSVAPGDYIAQLCSDVYRDLSGILLREMEQLQLGDPLDEEIARHEAFQDKAAAVFVGRAGVMQAVVEYIERGGPGPLCVHGVPGSGKSSILAHAATLARSVPGARIVRRFVGASAASADVRSMLVSVSKELARAYGRGDSYIPPNFQVLVREFHTRLRYATSQQPLILLIEAVDQMSDADDPQRFHWIELALPSTVRMIISTSDGDGLDALREWIPEGDPAPELGSTIHAVVRRLFARLSQASNHGKVLVSRSLAYGYREHARVEADVHGDKVRVRREHLQEHVAAPEGEQDTSDSSRCAEEQALRQHLTHQLHPASTDGQTNGDLALAR